MGSYYNSVPWFIPKVPKQFEDIFYKHCSPISFKRGTLLDAKLLNNNYSNYDFFIYLVDGMLSQAFNIDDPNKPVAMSITLPCRAVGYMYYIGKANTPETINVVALRDSQVMILPVEKLREIIGDNNELDRIIMEYCVSCIESDKDGLLTIFTKNVENRMKILLHSILDAFDISVQYGWNKLPIRLTHEEYSRIVYTTIETINRLLPKWKKENVYKSENGTIYIHSNLFYDDK